MEKKTPCKRQRVEVEEDKNKDCKQMATTTTTTTTTSTQKSNQETNQETFNNEDDLKRYEIDSFDISMQHKQNTNNYNDYLELRKIMTPYSEVKSDTLLVIAWPDSFISSLTTGSIPLWSVIRSIVGTDDNYRIIYTTVSSVEDGYQLLPRRLLLHELKKDEATVDIFFNRLAEVSDRFNMILIAARIAAHAVDKDIGSIIHGQDANGKQLWKPLPSLSEAYEKSFALEKQELSIKHAIRTYFKMDETLHQYEKQLKNIQTELKAIMPLANEHHENLIQQTKVDALPQNEKNILCSTVATLVFSPVFLQMVPSYNRRYFITLKSPWIRVPFFSVRFDEGILSSLRDHQIFGRFVKELMDFITKHRLAQGRNFKVEVDQQIKVGDKQYPECTVRYEGSMRRWTFFFYYDGKEKCISSLQAIRQHNKQYGDDLHTIVTQHLDSIEPDASSGLSPLVPFANEQSQSSSSSHQNQLVFKSYVPFGGIDK